jgi:hypothetical protein
VAVIITLVIIAVAVANPSVAGLDILHKPPNTPSRFVPAPKIGVQGLGSRV